MMGEHNGHRGGCPVVARGNPRAGCLDFGAKGSGLGRADALKRLAKLGLDASWQWKNAQAGFTPDEGLRPEQLTCDGLTLGHR